MKKTIYVTLVAILLLLSSCANTIKAPDDSWESIFLQYWNAMNTEYVHFSDDTSYDWDKIYEEYLPKFEALDYTNREDSITAFKYFKEIALNVYDNHYALIIKDGLGNTLKMQPAILRKFASNGGDIMDYPDIEIPSKLYGTVLVSVNNSGEDDGVSSNELAELKRKAIPSMYEVEDLLDGSKVKYGYFHNPDGGDITAEFTSCYGYTFNPFSKEEIALYTNSRENYYVSMWNTVIEKISIGKYFYGTTKDDVFYMYFSDFGNFLYLSDLLYRDMSKDEETKLVGPDNSELGILRGITRDIVVNSQSDTEISADVKNMMKIRGDGIKGIKDMYDALSAAIAEGKSIVVDLRGNGGGAVAFLEAIWGSFFNEPTQIGYVRYKSDYSRYEYTPWVSFSITEDFVNENLKTARYDKPVAVLVNGYSVSCSEVSCVIAKLLPNSRIIGHTTFGGTCALSDRTVYNAGPFQSEHLYIYTTTYQFVDNDKKSYELTGITPDITTDLNPKSDEAYKAAIKWIKENGN